MGNSILNAVKDLRRDIREKVQKEVLAEYTEARKEGKYPWEGIWMTPAQIGTAHEKLKRRDKIVLLELVIVFLLIIFFVLPTFSGMFVSFLPKQNGNIFSDTARKTPDTTAPVRKEETSSSHVSKSAGTNIPAARDSGAAVRRQEVSRTFLPDQKGKISRRGVRMRTGPGTTYKVISMLRYGEPITVINSGGHWVQIKTSQSADGWILGDYIRIIK